MSEPSCWLRNGTRARRALPCNHTALAEGKNTACCDPDDQCLTNGLCRDPAGNDQQNFVWFFGCTDRTFQDPVCGNYCDKANANNNHLIWQCHEKDTWCCNTGDPAPAADRANKSNTTCCKDHPDLVFNAPDPVFYTLALRTSGTPFPIVTLLPSTAMSKWNSTFRSETISATGSATSTSTSSALISAQGKDTSRAGRIGLGAGLGGGVLLALIVGLYVWNRKRKAKAAALAESPAPTVQRREEMTGQDVVEKSSKERYEIQDKEPPNEVVGDMFRAELSATSERTENRF